MNLLARLAAAAMQLARTAILSWEHPLFGGILAFIFYSAFASVFGPLWGEPTRYAHYNYLSDAFLHGQLHLRVIPEYTHDLSLFNGQYYLYWGPLPAVLLMPFVAVWGTQFSDTLFTIGIGALNVALTASLLRWACIRRVIRVSRFQRGLLVFFLALGTVHLPLTLNGSVWYTGQLVGFACVALTYIAPLRWHGSTAFLLTGSALACAMLTRNHLVFAGLWPAFYLLQRHWKEGWHSLLRGIGLGTTPILIAIGFLGLYNRLRFGRILENGIPYHQMAEIFVHDYQQYGLFDLHYLPTNLFYQYVAYPFPIRPETWYGGSLFLLSPVFLAVFPGIQQSQPRWCRWGLLGSIALLSIPILLLMGTGWTQFGPRYSLDFTVPLLLLTALGARCFPNWFLVLLTLISIVHYLVGALFLGFIV